MISATQSLSVQPYTIDPATRMGPVSLTVADLDRQTEFYREVVGLKLHWREGTTAGMGAGREDLLRLTVVRGARRVRGASGLYHFAVLLPNRRELARVIARLLSLRYPNYPTDHLMTKTTYLDDPEGNGIEVYAESPEDGSFAIRDGMPQAWRADGTPSDGREPLDLKALFKELDSEDRLDVPMPNETKIGHVHLHVADVARPMRFYHDLLGFENQGLSLSMGAGFVSAGNYHHHIAFNTWAGVGAPPPPPDSRGLRYLTILLPTQVDLDTLTERIRQTGLALGQAEEGILVRDPSQNGIVLSTPEKTRQAG
jgi:catechol 2,3-dioxygenase